MHRLAQEEVFGPVLCAMSFKNEAHAIELANATPFGLVAGVWTQDGARQFRMAKKVRAGQSSSTTTAQAAGWNCRLAG
jgi:aldehyde dehydrogenase (NAD+)